MPSRYLQHLSLTTLTTLFHRSMAHAKSIVAVRDFSEMGRRWKPMQCLALIRANHLTEDHRLMNDAMSIRLWNPIIQRSQVRRSLLRTYSMLQLTLGSRFTFDSHTCIKETLFVLPFQCTPNAIANVTLSLKAPSGQNATNVVRRRTPFCKAWLGWFYS